jgi:hypothetical protein
MYGLNVGLAGFRLIPLLNHSFSYRERGCPSFWTAPYDSVGLINEEIGYDQNKIYFAE